MLFSKLIIWRLQYWYIRFGPFKMSGLRWQICMMDVDRATPNAETGLPVIAPCLSA